MKKILIVVVVVAILLAGVIPILQRPAEAKADLCSGLGPNCVVLTNYGPARTRDGVTIGARLSWSRSLGCHWKITWVPQGSRVVPGYVERVKLGVLYQIVAQRFAVMANTRQGIALTW
jgi:hypothetical protein